MTTTEEGLDSAPLAPVADATAIRETIDAVRAHPHLGEVTFTVTSRPGGGLRAVTTTGALHQGGLADESRRDQFEVASDEPVALLGTDSAISPAEYALHALAGCYTVTIASLAAIRGIQLDAVGLDLGFDINLNGFLDIDDSVRKGATQIRVAVDLRSDSATREELAALVQAVEDTSPLRDTLANPVDVVTTLK